MGAWVVLGVPYLGDLLLWHPERVVRLDAEPEQMDEDVREVAQ